MNNDSFIDINFINHDQYTSKGLILLDFWAPWCTACSTQDNIYGEISLLFYNKIVIGKINIADNRVLADKYGVRNIPFLILLKNGQKVFQMAGIENKEYLVNQIKNSIK